MYVCFFSDPKAWDPRTSGQLYQSVYSYEATSESELSFRENEVIKVAPAEYQLPNNEGWLFASNRTGKTGYVPVTRLGAKAIKIKPKNEINISTSGK